MTKPTITGTTTVSLGTVLNEDVQLVRRIPQLNLPLTTSSQTLGTGILGAVRVVTIQGIWAGIESALKTFNTSMEAWSNIANMSTRVYTDSLNNTYNVRCIDYVRIRSPEGPGRMLYTMTFIETV